MIDDEISKPGQFLTAHHLVQVLTSASVLPCHCWCEDVSILSPPLATVSAYPLYAVKPIHIRARISIHPPFWLASLRLSRVHLKANAFLTRRKTHQIRQLTPPISIRRSLSPGIVRVKFPPNITFRTCVEIPTGRFCLCACLSSCYPLVIQLSDGTDDNIRFQDALPYW